MSDLAKRLLASIRFNAIHGDSQERAVCERQMAEAARVLGEQAAENDRLRAENERLRAENEALRADAERYRWVREPRKGIDVLSRKSGDDRWYYRYGKDLDEYIDSDMARKSER